MKTIHQFTPSVAYGDGVTAGLFFTRSLLRELGFVSEIFAHQIDPRLLDEVHPLHEYSPSPDQILLFHHSIGHEHDALIFAWPDRLILVYHNITPEHFFEDSPHLAGACRRGRSQLAQWPRGRFLGSYADSDYNRDELSRLGYPDVRTIPLLVDLSRLESPPPSPSSPSADDPYTILFVGRIVENKCQDQLIDVLDELRLAGVGKIRLVLVGGVSSAPYRDFIETKIAALGLGDSVLFTGKVSDEELRRWYVSADLYLSLSEHEGFGMPLLEATAHNLPVLAYDAGALSTTLPDASLIRRKAPGWVADRIIEMMDDSSLRRRVLLAQRTHLHRFERRSLKSVLASFLEQLGITLPAALSAGYPSDEPSVHMRIDGPCDSTYSLALVNRELGRSLMEEGEKLSFFATEGPGDYSPDREFLLDDPQVLGALSDTPSAASVVIRNLYPPRVSGMGGLTKILGPYGWEESAFPPEHVLHFNRRLSGIACMSEYVADVLRNNGVKVPLRVTGIGADHILRYPPEPLGIDLPEGERLLHVSSCFPRKGADLLIRALQRLKRPVTLIVKTFPNPHNTLRADLLRQGWEAVEPSLYRWGNQSVLILEEEFSMGQMRTLYTACEMLVAPTRGEGFGLPQAEAMFLSLPVITTAYGGQSDFCTPRTAWLLDFAFAPAQSHMGLFDSVWAEPDPDDLVANITEVLECDPHERTQKTDAARTLVETRFTWRSAAMRVADFITSLETSPFGETDSPAPADSSPHDITRKPKKKKIGWVSTYATQCGIAEYSRHLIEPMKVKPTVFAPYASLSRPDEANVIRCWSGENLDRLSDAVSIRQIDTLMIQFNYSLFDFAVFAGFIDAQIDAGREVFVTLHSTIDDEPETKKLILLAQTFKRCTLLVHTAADLNRLKALGLTDNVILFPHGIVDYPIPIRPRHQGKAFRLAAYGFFLPSKGFLELIDAVALLRAQGTDVLLDLVTARYPAPVSNRLIDEAIARITDHSLGNVVRLETSFLSDAESLEHLYEADLIVFPYRDTGESSSAAVRFGIASGRPVAVTSIPIFDELADAVIRMEGFDPSSLASSLSKLIVLIRGDDPSLAYTATKAEQWRSAHVYPAVSARLESILAR